MSDDLDIPDFLRRTETAEEAEAWRKKYLPRERTTLKVIQPLMIPDKIRRAIDRDLRDDLPPATMTRTGAMKIGKRETELRHQREERMKENKRVAKAPDEMAELQIPPPMADELEKVMRGKTSKRKAKSDARTGVKRGSKSEKVVALLNRSEGCTIKDVLKATGWPSISMPHAAKQAGLKLKKEKKKGEPTRYYAA